ncbi:MAG: hypothetical protein EA350_04360 [Gemmatimonadales bacterium]|nr:MAG: hypothetical protein EA350_04360 [Gemmatimonadales bacterium]
MAPGPGGERTVRRRAGAAVVPWLVGGKPMWDERARRGSPGTAPGKRSESRQDGSDPEARRAHPGRR